MPQQRKQSSSSLPSSKPSLIVFDLDNTIWTPELYQLRRLERSGGNPVAGKDVNLFPGARSIIESIRASPDKWSGTSFAVASRTKSGPWAHDLLDQFGLRDFFDHVEIFPGNKKAHFENLKRDSGVPYNEMLFFDDSRDGRFGNCQPVSELGVLSVHCPDGLRTDELFHTAMKRYTEWSGKPNTIIEWDGSVSEVAQIPEGERLRGVVKMVNNERLFGFIKYKEKSSKDLFFHFSNLPEGGRGVMGAVSEGDEISFVVETDRKNGKKMATKIKKHSWSSSSISSSATTNEDSNAVNMRAFSMNLPFAALLANGYKTLETRNGTMFTPYPEGTKMLLHVGRRTYPDGDRHIEVMRSGGLSDTEIEDLKSLPGGFGRGMAVAILEIGKTYETTVQERSDPDVQ
eukprot:899712-Ditylum_brightwellii.AAC.1